jgi:hypothetical protein
MTFDVFTAVKTPCDLVEVINVSEENIASIFSLNFGYGTFL